MVILPELTFRTCRWALGVLVYEMVAGYPPFYDEDRVIMFKNICHVKYTFPSSFGKVLAALPRSSLRCHCPVAACHPSACLQAIQAAVCRGGEIANGSSHYTTCTCRNISM